MRPQVIVLLAGGAFVSPFVRAVSLEHAAWSSALAVVLGLAVDAVLGVRGYGWIALALVLVAAGLRVNGVVAGTNVLRGLPEHRTSIGAALVDTANEVASGVGVAVAGTVLAALFSGAIIARPWSPIQTGEFHDGVLIAGVVLTVIAAALVGTGILRTAGAPQDPRGAEPEAAGTHRGSGS